MALSTGQTTKKLSQWLICGKCGTPLDSGLGSLRGSDNSPKVTLVQELGKEPVLVHASCIVPTPMSDAIMVDSQMGMPQLYGFDASQFDTGLIESAVRDPRTLVTVCTQNNFLVSLVKKGHTNAIAVLESAKKGAAAYNLLCSWLTVYRVPGLGPSHAAWVSGMYPIKTAAFVTEPGKKEEILFVRLNHFHSQQKPVPPISPDPSYEVVYQKCSLSISDDGLEVCVNATHVPVDKPHVFFARSNKAPSENYVFIKKAGEGDPNVVMPAVVVTFDRPLSPHAIAFVEGRLRYSCAVNVDRPF